MSTIPHKLSVVIQRSHSLDTILQSAVDIVADEMGTDVSSIYLLDLDGARLRLMASRGLDRAALGKVSLAPGEGLTGKVVAEMRPLAVEDASSHPGYRYFPETKEERFKSYLGVPMAIRNRPVGAVVVQSCKERTYSQHEVETLSTIAAQLVGVVENARLIDALDRGEDDVRFLDEVRRWRDTAPVDAGTPRVDVRLEGTPASGGIAIAPAVFRGTIELDSESIGRESLGPEAERQRYTEALEKTRAEILEIQKAAEREADEEHALIFSSHILLLNDPVLARRVFEDIDAGATAHLAAFRALETFENRLLAVRDPYIRERVEDIRDLRSRMLQHLLEPRGGGRRLEERIVVTHGLPPSLVVELKAEGASGLITEFGGTTSHGALLARSMGIPAVTGVTHLGSRVRGGDLLVVDGDEGVVIVNPSEDTLATYEERVEQLSRQADDAREWVDRPAATRDGVRVEIHANIGVATDLKLARAHGADGIGLYRTEFPFIVREHFPTREEQIKIYARAYEFFPDGRINFRLLDLGGDKFLAGDEIDTDRNPFHGYRSIRVLLDHPDVLRDQVQAFALAAGGRPFNVLIPLISTLEELRRSKELIGEALAMLPDEGRRSTPKIGVMVELPATVEIARPLAREVDYLSIGTNDLIQYSLAIDREHSRLASRSDPFHPAVLRMLHRTITAAHAEGKPVGICGELASNPVLALAVIAMGVDSLSVTPGSILRLKRELARHDAGPLRRELPEILELGEASEIEARLKVHAAQS